MASRDGGVVRVSGRAGVEADVVEQRDGLVVPPASESIAAARVEPLDRSW